MRDKPKRLDNVTRFRVGPKEFKTEWGAWCYVAKMRLVDELEKEVRLSIRPNCQMDLDVTEFENLRKAAFQAKYPWKKGDLEYCCLGWSPFRIAVMELAKRLRLEAGS